MADEAPQPGAVPPPPPDHAPSPPASPPASPPDPLAAAREAMATEEARQHALLAQAKRTCAAELDAVLRRHGFRIIVALRAVDSGALGLTVQGAYDLAPVG